MPKAPPASWPITVQLIPPDRLKALIYYHRIETPVSGIIWCWTYISQGLGRLGQKEVLFTIRRRVTTEDEGNYPREPLEWFRGLHSLAQQGILMDNFQPTILDSPLFLDRLDFTMIVHCPPTPINNVPTSSLPEERLHVIFLTTTEAEVLRRCGAMRALAHLGFSQRWFPFPPWIDRDRRHCITIADMEGTIRDKMPFASVREVSAYKRGSEIVLHVPRRAEEQIKPLLTGLAPSYPIPLDSYIYDGSDSGMLWKRFILFWPDQEKDEWQLEEDGYIFFLTRSTWMRIRRAIEASTTLVIPVEGSFQFCLEYASQQPQSKRTAATEARDRDIGSPISASSRAQLEYSLPLRHPPCDSCKTCSVTHGLKAISATSKVDEGSQVHQSSPALETRPTALATTIGKLQSDAEKGCDKCSLLYKGIKAYLPYLSGQTTGMIYISGNETRLYCAVGLKQGWASVLEFTSCDSEPCPWLLLEENPKTSSVMPSNEGLEHARRWLQSCESDHDSCSAVHPTPLPTRVLDLGTSIDGTGDLHLYESSGETGSYCALSLCGYSGQSPKTTLRSIDDHKAGIKFSQLPSTLQKAVLVCRKLGLRYLWSESLCIIQDDDQDWHNESVSMAKTYGNSRLTIAISGVWECTDGCFMSTSPVQHARKLRWPGVGGEGGYSMYVRHSFEHAAFYDSDPKQTNVPVMSRAWVHQERLLSPRILYLGKAELIWKCKEACRCQCGYSFHGNSGNT